MAPGQRAPRVARVIQETDQYRDRMERQRMLDELTGANRNTGRDGQAGGENRPRSQRDVPTRDDTFRGGWPRQEPRPPRRPHQFDFSRGNSTPVEGRDNGGNRRAPANRWNGPPRNRSAAQNRTAPRQQSDLPMLLTLPAAPPQVSFRKVAPRVRTRRPEPEPGRSRWDEQPTQGRREEQPVRRQWPEQPTRSHREEQPTRSHREEQPTRSHREEPGRSRWQDEVTNNVPGAQTRTINRSTGGSQTRHVGPVEQNQTSVPKPVATEPREHAADVEPSNVELSDVEPSDIEPSTCIMAATPAAPHESRSLGNAGPSTEQTPAHMPAAEVPHVRPRNEPLLIDDGWRRQPDVTVIFGPGLRKTVSVMDIFLAIQDFGIVEMIDLIVDNNGDRIGKAQARLREVTTPFWLTGSINISRFKKAEMVPVAKRPYTGVTTVASKTNPSKFYPAKLRFDVESVEIGFMLKPEEFMSMYQTRPGSKITWEVNLLKRRIELMFPLFFDEKDPEVQKLGPPHTDPRTYLVEIPFSHLHELFVPADEDKGGRTRTFVIPLPDPPKVSREVVDWTTSMSEPGMNRWTIHDVYMRQTDIELVLKSSRNHPVSLRHVKPIIDIGRWTTYRLSFDLIDDGSITKFETMLEALKEFNVHCKPLPEMHVEYDQSKLDPIWNYLDQGLASKATNADLLRAAFLPFPVRYQLEVCISHGYLNEYNLTPEVIDRLASLSERDAVALLEAVQEKKTRFFEPMDIFKLPRDRKIDLGRSIPSFCTYMRRATITPTGILFHTPSVEISNRVIRHYERYADRFIRITFTDEKSTGRIRFTDKSNSNELFTRVYRALAQGVVIGERHYEFLAFGNSQLREHSAYFFARAHDVSVKDIREWMGEFSNIRVIAKNASRLGQCFSTTKAFKSCDVTLKKIPDIERNGYNFSDGVGTMSPIVAHLLSQDFAGDRRISPDYRASCFQFRLGGHKGILALDPKAVNLEVHLRPSQEKFWSPHKTLEIIRCSQFASASLNRQLIQVMSNLGVPDEFFRRRLTKILSDYSTAIRNPSKALELLTKHVDPNYQTVVIANLIRYGFMASSEPFVMSLMHLWRAWTIKYLKEKAKITIDDGAFLLGVVDETGKLRGYYEEALDEDELPQIFCQITDMITKRPTIITGRCVVARNPSLHPGDVRIVEAVDVPELHHLIDVVVFPQTGDRDIPSMLSGGDLDGDDYVVIWDKELTAPGVMINEPPASYTAQPPNELDRDVVIDDIAKFFVNYMRNDRLGAIANAHLAWADKHTLGVKSPICLELATLHSDAVDYPKTGKEAKMMKKHRIRNWPHFFEKPQEEGWYHSDKILGQLYDMVERVDFTPCYHLPPNENIMTAFELSEEELEEAATLKAEYDAAMYRIMAQHDIKSEFEVWSTFVMHHGGANDYKFHEEIGGIAHTLKQQFSKYILEKCADSRSTRLPRMVAAMYVVTHTAIENGKLEIIEEKQRRVPRSRGKSSAKTLTKEDTQKLPLMSFPWLFSEVLARLAKGYKDIPHDYSGSGHCGTSFMVPLDEEEYEHVPIEDLNDDNIEAVNEDDVELQEFDEEEQEFDEELQEFDEELQEFDEELQEFDEEVQVEEFDDAKPEAFESENESEALEFQNEEDVLEAMIDKL